MSQVHDLIMAVIVDKLEFESCNSDENEQYSIGEGDVGFDKPIQPS